VGVKLEELEEKRDELELLELPHTA